ncbi:hypothetical protein DL98DRAFT_565394 [Cadophora sp. DSE1049]|nr:hypothetical protein DL98DRAFT_565394 [Cadophora sp. DSE1049]
MVLAYVCSVAPLPLEVGSLCCGCLLPHATERLVGFLSHHVPSCLFSQNEQSSSGEILRRWGTAVTLKKKMMAKSGAIPGKYGYLCPQLSEFHQSRQSQDTQHSEFHSTGLREMVRVAHSYGGYQDEADTTSFRRYSARGHDYPISHDREFPTVASHGVFPGARNHHPSPHEPRTVGQSPESDSNSRPRSRIPVACGRCRKRKIRCSGDAGGSCTNCKNAGNDQCQFLRVSSEPAHMKNECATYDFDSSGGAASRINCRTGMMPFGPHSFAPQPAPLPLDGYQYRNISLPTYPYQVKPYYQMSYGDFSDEPVDYGLQGSLMGNDHLGLTSNYITTSSSGRGWTSAPAPAPPMPKTPLFIEQSDTPYSHHQLPFHAYPLRGSMNSESKNGSMNGMSATLPPPPVNTSVDRMLPPVPSTNNRLAQIGPFLRSSDGLPSTSTLQSQSQSQSFSDYNMIRGNKNHNGNAVSDNSSMSTGYLPMSSTSPESLSSSQMAYGSQPPMHMSQQSDMYTPSSTDGLCANESSGESSYGHASEGSKRGSNSSQTSNGDGSLPPLSNGGGRLVNDREYHYVPTGINANGYPYPVPPIQQPTPVSSRPSISVGADQE